MRVRGVYPDAPEGKDAMLYRKNIKPFCAYCTHAGRIDESKMICPRRGIVSVEGSCWGFRYDPLKRVPPRPAPKLMDDFKPEDFLL